MSKSKRNKIVSLSKIKKKGKEHKESVVNVITEPTENYNSVYVFSFENRRTKFKEVREQLKPTSNDFVWVSLQILPWFE